MLSTMLQLKISKTKKRLFDDKWGLPIISVCFMGLFSVLAFTLRAVSLGGHFGGVEALIPVLSDTAVTPAHFSKIHTGKEYIISEKTPVIAINEEALFFGDMTGFTKDLWDVRKRFKIPHYRGAPQVNILLKDLNTWLESQGAKNEQAAIVLASDLVPVPILIQLIHYLKESPFIEEISLGGQIH